MANPINTASQTRQPSPFNPHTSQLETSQAPTSPAIQVDTYIEGAQLTQIPTLTEAHYRTWIQTWLQVLAPQSSPINAYEVTLTLTTDADIQQLNTDYRQQAKPTDVLSFAALETAIPGAECLYRSEPLPLGDIIISVETAARQARIAQHSLTRELAWLAAHVLLHLLGWDHPDETSLSRMLNKQSELLLLIQLPDVAASEVVSSELKDR